MGLLALVRATQSRDWILVRRFRRIPPLSLKADAKFKTTPREFAKDSRVFVAFPWVANRAPKFFFPRKTGSQDYTGIRYANAAANERNT
jgi:hypothetical protein